MADVFCNNCGHKNGLGSNFCSSCGNPLERSVDDPTTISFQIDAAQPAPDGSDSGEFTFDLDDIPPDGGLLVVVRGPIAGARLALTKDVTTAGRHPDSDLFLDDVTVSRRHVEFRRASGGFALRDVGSLNGTFLNRERIDADATLKNGDEIQIGKYRLSYFSGR
ncbi:MAG: zinc-ribbon and FHA domain-containing protein [Actinomycetota bacterium]|nr:FHA domain-containing protein [Acidimicrobiia bacterium]MDQ3293024.1 zinc-ribbon and FHA domain-containing protein [Actinomycetota bacterium]